MQKKNPTIVELSKFKIVRFDASVHDETNQKLKLKPDSIRDA